MKAREPFRPMTYSDIGRVLREKLGGNFPGIEPDPPPKAIWFCDIASCDQSHDPNTGEVRGQCKGYCAYG